MTLSGKSVSVASKLATVSSVLNKAEEVSTTRSARREAFATAAEVLALLASEVKGMVKALDQELAAESSARFEVRKAELTAMLAALDEGARDAAIAAILEKEGLKPSVKVASGPTQYVLPKSCNDTVLDKIKSFLPKISVPVPVNGKVDDGEFSDFTFQVKSRGMSSSAIVYNLWRVAPELKAISEDDLGRALRYWAQNGMLATHGEKGGTRYFLPKE